MTLSPLVTVFLLEPSNHVSVVVVAVAVVAVVVVAVVAVVVVVVVVVAVVVAAVTTLPTGRFERLCRGQRQTRRRICKDR